MKILPLVTNVCACYLLFFLFFLDFPPIIHFISLSFLFSRSLIPRSQSNGRRRGCKFLILRSSLPVQSVLLSRLVCLHVMFSFLSFFVSRHNLQSFMDRDIPLCPPTFEATPSSFDKGTKLKHKIVQKTVIVKVKADINSWLES